MASFLILSAALAIIVMLLIQRIELRPYLAGALAAHILLLVIALFWSDLGFRPRKPTRITMIKLSRGDGGTNTKANLKNSQNLPDATIKEQKEVLKEMAKGKIGDDRSTKDSKTEKTIKLKQESQKTKVSEKGGINTSKRDNTKTRAKEDDVIARIDNMTKQREVEVNAAQTRNEDTGQSPFGSDEGSTIDPQLMAYYNIVKSKIKKNWIKGEYQGTLRAHLVVTIDGMGNTLSVEVEKSSGNGSFDESARRAVKRSAPFPPPPASIKDEVLTEGFEFDFFPNSMSGKPPA